MSKKSERAFKAKERKVGAGLGELGKVIGVSATQWVTATDFHTYPGPSLEEMARKAATEKAMREEVKYIRRSQAMSGLISYAATYHPDLQVYVEHDQGRGVVLIRERVSGAQLTIHDHAFTGLRSPEVVDWLLAEIRKNGGRRQSEREQFREQLDAARQAEKEAEDEERIRRIGRIKGIADDIDLVSCRALVALEDTPFAHVGEELRELVRILSKEIKHI